MQKHDKKVEMKGREKARKPLSQVVKDKRPAMEVLLGTTYPEQMELSRELFSAVQEKDGEKLKSLMEQGAHLGFEFEDEHREYNDPGFKTFHTIRVKVTPMSQLLASDDAELICVAAETLKAEREELLDVAIKERAAADAIPSWAFDNPTYFDSAERREHHSKLRKGRIQEIDSALEKIETKLKLVVDKLRSEVESSILRNPNFMSNDDRGVGGY